MPEAYDMGEAASAMQVLCSVNSKPIWGMYLNNDPSSRTSRSAHIITKVANQMRH